MTSIRLILKNKLVKSNLQIRNNSTFWMRPKYDLTRPAPVYTYHKTEIDNDFL